MSESGRTPRQGDPCQVCGKSTFFPRWSRLLERWLCLVCQTVEDNAPPPSHIVTAPLPGDADC